MHTNIVCESMASQAVIFPVIFSEDAFVCAQVVRFSNFFWKSSAFQKKSYCPEMEWITKLDDFVSDERMVLKEGMLTSFLV